jgi:hypothetical protein
MVVQKPEHGMCLPERIPIAAFVVGHGDFGITHFLDKSYCKMEGAARFAG